MPVDYRRLVEGLGDALAAVGPELPAVRSLVVTLSEAVGAAGGTFTESGPQGGRVVVAEGAMAWALGQRVLRELVTDETLSQPFRGPVELLPRALAQPLRIRGFVAVAGHPICSGD